MSLSKYLHNGGNGRGQLFWQRAGVDGAPFRGHHAPLLRDEEFEELTETVVDGRVKIFDLSDANDRAEYEDVLDKACNGWYRILLRVPQWVEAKLTWFVYCEWAVRVKELSPARARSARFQEGRHDAGNAQQSTSFLRLPPQPG